MKSNDNFATEGLSGTYKQVVFRQRFGQTILSKRPKRKSRVASAAQELIKSTFKLAAVYAKAILVDEVIKAAYKAKAKIGESAFNRALADYFKPPVIGEIDHSNYNGQPGSIITAVVTDDFRVASVKASISKANGNILEEGVAVLQPDGLRWTYTATVASAAITGTGITITATDLPGNPSSSSKTL